MKRIISLIMVITISMTLCIGLTGCEEVSQAGARHDVSITMEVTDDLLSNQPTPKDISYSLERYNLTRRAYWVNGQREKANSLVCKVQKPLGYIVLFSGSTIVGNFVVDGKVSSLNSYLTPDSEYYEYSAGDVARINHWLADVDGSYGENDSGIFFFTTDGKYIEWTGTYLYSDIPFIVDNPVLSIGG